MIEVISIQLSILLELSNKALNTALCANEISAKPSANLILLKGFKRIQHQVYAAVLANLPILSSYYARFAIELVKNIN